MPYAVKFAAREKTSTTADRYSATGAEWRSLSRAGDRKHSGANRTILASPDPRRRIDRSVREDRKKIAGKDRRIRLVRYPARGLIATLNAGLKLCRAPFVARQDADDISFPGRLAAELDYLRRNRKCIAVSGGGKTIDQKGLKAGNAWFHNPHLADPFWVPAREPYLSHPFLMMRREIYQRLGYRNFFIS